MPEQTFPHTLNLTDREKLTLTGITEVITFDDTTVIMHTTLGRVTVLGSRLQLKSLTPDGGNVTVHGQIDAISYEEPRADRGWLSRFFS